MSDQVAVGIDLGTTNSCVSVFNDHKVIIIPNSDGKNITPSVVGFTKNGRIVGAQAKSNAFLEPKNTIFDAKRLIGRKYEDAEVQEDIKHWPFSVVNDESKPKIEVIMDGKRRTYFPEEISSIILCELKEIAEKHLGKKINNCVITVPAHFNDSQRQATIDAGTIAGLNVMKIINEPTAAAVAYGYNNKSTKEQHVCVFDLGGGTFDVSIVKIKGTKISIASSGGDTHLGGEDFDTRIMKYAIKEFEQKHKINVEDNTKAIQRLRAMCEKAKIDLTSSKETVIDIVGFHKNLDLYITLTREKFEEINNDLFSSTINTISNCLECANLKKNQIDKIILVGGSSRIPKVRQIVKDYFDGKPLDQSVNPDEAVAIGAAINAAMFQYQKTREIQEVELYDVTPMSLGINVLGDKMDVVIKKNTPIPVKQVKEYTTSYDNQKAVTIKVLEGENKYTKDNNVLGDFTIEGFPLKKAGEVNFDVTFEVDANGVFTIDCKEKSTSIKDQLKITYDKGRLSSDNIERMREENAKERESKRTREDATEEKSKIYDYCNDALEKVSIKSKKMSAREEVRQIREKCDDTMNWLDLNQDKTKQEYMEKYEDVKSYCERNFRFL